MQANIWQEILFKKNYTMFSLIGGGGKSSLLYYLWKLCQSENKITIATTTTKLACEEWAGEKFFFIDDFAGGLSFLKTLKNASLRQVFLASCHKAVQQDKVIGPEKKWLDIWHKTLPQYYFLIEADGSKGRSFKVHKKDEPVLPQTTDLVLAVMGFDAFNKPLEEKYLHRLELINKFAQAKNNAFLSKELIAALLLGNDQHGGYFHNTPLLSKKMLYINKVESDKDWHLAKELVFYLRIQGFKELIILGSLKQQKFQKYDEAIK